MKITPVRSQWIYTEREIAVHKSQKGMWNKEILCLFACDCIEEALSTERDPDIDIIPAENAIRAARMYINKEITEEELNAAAYASLVCSRQCIKKFHVIEHYISLAATLVAESTVKSYISAVQISARYLEYAWLSTRLWTYLRTIEETEENFDINIAGANDTTGIQEVIE